MKVVWGLRARQHLFDIAGYIRQENPPAAKRVANRIRRAANGLSKLPDRFREGVLPGTREYVVPGLPYIMVYQVESDRVLIRALFHAAQDKPRGG